MFKARLLPLMTAALIVVGCSGGSNNESTPTNGTKGSASGDAKSGGKLRIAVIPKGSTHEFWKSVHAGADDAAAELKDVEIIWKGPLKEDDRDSQVKTVEDFVNQKVNGIVLAPLDDTALRAPVKEAVKSDIPVVIIDSALNGGNTVSFVATNNRKGGFTAGEHLAKLLNGKGKVMMMRYQEGSASTMEREAGFSEAIKKYPGIEVVSDNQYGGATVESAQKTAENLIARFKQGDKLSVDGIYTPNESTTFGMLKVLEGAGVAGKVKFVGFDASPKLIDGLSAGKIDGLIVQNPRKMGYLGVKTLVSSIKKQKVETLIDTGATLVTKENMNSDENKKLLAPPGN